MINISIDLSKIDKTRIKTGKNGEKYYSLTADKKKEADKFGNDHSVYNTPTKEEREKKLPKVYLGSGKEFNFNGNSSTANTSNYQAPAFNPSPETVDDLPF